MSVKKIGSNDSMSSFANKIYGTTAVGTVAGGVYTATHKNWIYKGLPSDKFVHTVSRNLREEMTSDELKESAKISRFLADTVNPITKLEDLKPQILDSKELSEAIKNSPEETVEDAINRVFAQPKDKVKKDLLELQFKTKADKKTGKNTAVRLINNNFDAAKRKLVKSAETSERTFDMIKATAFKLQAKTVAIGAVLTGAVAGALALVISNVPEKNG